MNQNETVVVSMDIQELKGIGTEYLLDEDGNVVAKFIDGMLPEPIPAPNEDVTK